MHKLIGLSPMIAILCATSCSEVIEKDLEGYNVVLLTPPAGHSTTVNQLEFRWEEVPHATSYRIQIATPDFINPVQYKLDSAIDGTMFTQNLTPGSYQWRVRAENSNSHTDYSTRSFTIVSTELLTGLVPVLIAPADGWITNDTSIDFVWDTLPFTDDHRFELREEDPEGSLVTALITADHELTLTGLADGEYAWGVQAQNDVPSTSEFSYRQLTVDATAPSLPVQLSPASGTSITNEPFSFLWQSGVDAQTATDDSLIVKNALLQVIRAIGGLSGVHADSLGTGTYTWTVKTCDAADNCSSAGPIAFDVQ